MLEVRKKGTWDMSEEERQRRLRAQMPMKKRFQMGLARLVKPHPRLRTFPARGNSALAPSGCGHRHGRCTCPARPV